MLTVTSAFIRLFFVAFAILGISIIAVDLEDAQKWLNERLGVSMTQREITLVFFLIAAVGLLVQAQYTAFRSQRQKPRLKLKVWPGTRYESCLAPTMPLSRYQVWPMNHPG